VANFQATHGLRITGDVVAVGGEDAVAEIDVTINGRPQVKVAANRISSHSFKNGGSFYGGFDYAVPMKSFKGGMCIVALSDAASSLGISEFEFGSEDYVYEEMLLLLEYGEQIHSGKTISPVAHSAVLANMLAGYMMKKAETRSGIKLIGKPVLDWLLRLVEGGYLGPAMQLLLTLSLLELIKADAIKVVQLFIVLCSKGTNEQRKSLADYVAKFPRLSGGDTHNMLSLCLRCRDVRKPVTIDDIKQQIVRWRFSGNAMLTSFDFTEQVFGREALADLKVWAMQEWLELSGANAAAD
jgi:hypothetical protein